MSSHDIEHGDYLLFVGWDRPLDTFFATLETLVGHGTEEPEMLIGGLPGEYRDVESFTAALDAALQSRNIVDFSLSEEIWQRLQADYNENPPGAGQQATTESMQAFNQWLLHDDQKQ